MRYHEIASGLRLPVSSEERDLLSRAEGDGVAQASLDEREREVARHMVSRGLLHRRRDQEGRIFYRVNSVKDIWRER